VGAVLRGGAVGKIIHGGVRGEVQGKTDRGTGWVSQRCFL